MKAFSFIRSSLTGGGAGQPLASVKPEATLGVPKVPSLLFDLEVYRSCVVSLVNESFRERGIDWLPRRTTFYVSDEHLLLQLEEGAVSLADMPEDAGAAVVASHVCSLTELRTEEERQVTSCSLQLRF